MIYSDQLNTRSGENHKYTICYKSYKSTKENERKIETIESSIIDLQYLTIEIVSNGKYCFLLYTQFRIS